MRDIRFRALVEKSGKSHPAVGGFEQYNQIIKVESITFNDDGVDLVVDENGDEYSYHDETLLAVMQNTGLKDQNGIEIYEGDVVATGYNNDTKGVVVFGDGMFYVDCGDTDMHFNHPDRYEVIGNVYEHPHLIQEVD